MTEIKQIAVLGAGTMGHGITQVASQIGKYNVVMYDLEQRFVDKGLERIRRSLKKFVSKRLLSEEEMIATLGRIQGTINLEEAVFNADLIIETITENIESKKALLREVDKLSPSNAIVVSNTSSVKISELSQNFSRPNCFCGMHFFNPPQLMELVEFTKGELTSEETQKVVIEVAHKMGKQTVVLKKDSSGGIVNRILLAALIEATNLFFSGVAEKEDIDKAIKLGLKWPMGPLMLIDNIGVDTVVAIAENLRDGNDSKFCPSSKLNEMRENGALGRKTGKGFYNWYAEKNYLNEA